jgi:hypothetical protein
MIRNRIKSTMKIKIRTEQATTRIEPCFLSCLELQHPHTLPFS